MSEFKRVLGKQRRHIHQTLVIDDEMILRLLSGKTEASTRVLTAGGHPYDAGSISNVSRTSNE